MLTVPGQSDIPLPIRPGDFDVDGFPDLLITISDGKKSLVKVLGNVPCGKGVIGCGDFSAKYSRGFQVLGGKGWEALEAIEDAVGASWIDLDDDVSGEGEFGEAHRRGRSTSWCTVPASRRGTGSRSSRTTSTTTRSSSRGKVRTPGGRPEADPPSAQRRVRSEAVRPKRRRQAILCELSVTRPLRALRLVLRQLPRRVTPPLFLRTRGSRC